MTKQQFFTYFLFWLSVPCSSKWSINHGSNNRSHRSADSYQKKAKIEFCPAYLSADCFEMTFNIISFTASVWWRGGGSGGASLSSLLMLDGASGGKRGNGRVTVGNDLYNDSGGEEEGLSLCQASEWLMVCHSLFLKLQKQQHQKQNVTPYYLKMVVAGS